MGLHVNFLLLFFVQIDYTADEIQLRHLRMNSVRVRQNVTYHCRNSHAFKESHGKDMAFIKFMNADGVEMHTDAHPVNRPKVIMDGCNVRLFSFIISLLEVITITTFSLIVSRNTNFAHRSCLSQIGDSKHR